MEKYLSKDQVKAIIEGAPKGYTPGKVVDGLVARGCFVTHLFLLVSSAAKEHFGK